MRVGAEKRQGLRDGGRLLGAYVRTRGLFRVRVLYRPFLLISPSSPVLPPPPSPRRTSWTAQTSTRRPPARARPPSVRVLPVHPAHTSPDLTLSQPSISPPLPCRTRSTSWRRLCHRPGSRTPPAMPAGPYPAPLCAFIRRPIVICLHRARKVKCNQVPGQDKVRRARRNPPAFL